MLNVCECFVQKYFLIGLNDGVFPQLVYSMIHSGASTPPERATPYHRAGAGAA